MEAIKKKSCRAQRDEKKNCNFYHENVHYGFRLDNTFEAGERQIKLSTFFCVCVYDKPSVVVRST